MTDSHMPNAAAASTELPSSPSEPMRQLRLVAPYSRRRLAAKPLGVASVDKPTLLGVSVPDARHHLHVLGPTGVGKSTLLVNLVIADVQAGRGVAVFDPKGDLIRDLLDRLPIAAADRVVLIDPDERDAPAALNLFDLAHDPETVAAQLVGVMSKVFAPHWGNRTDDLARHAVLTLAHLPGATLTDIPKVLGDAAYRNRIMRQVRARADAPELTELEAFWAWYASQPPGQIAVQVGPLLSKVRAVLSRRFANELFGIGATTFRLEDVLDGGVLLVRLPPTLGEDTVRLVGSLLLAALLHAASGRADLPEADRLDASLVLDEAHQFLNLPAGVETALATARALGLSLVLAHQHLGQLNRVMFEAIDANARNKIFFTLAPRDARDLVHHVAPYFTPDDLRHRDAYGFVARLVIAGRDGEPFSLVTRPAPPIWPNRAEILRAAARSRGLPQLTRRQLTQARLLGPAASGLAGHQAQRGTPAFQRGTSAPTTSIGRAGEATETPTIPSAQINSPTHGADQ